MRDFKIVTVRVLINICLTFNAPVDLNLLEQRPGHGQLYGDNCRLLMCALCGAQERVEFDEPDYALIDTLFSLAEAHLFMQLIELRERQPDIMPPNKSCADIYRRARVL